MIDKGIVTQLVEDFLKTSSSYLVQVEVRPGNSIVVEIDNDEAVSIEECVKLNRFIESSLDREEEDYELEVGSSGLSSPFKILKQYQKNIGNEVEILTKGGQKLHGVLKAADEERFIVTIVKKVKPEGAKRKIEVEEDLPFTYEEIKYTKYLIRFK
ncbi:MAG: ribosome assembly cofactor RimP [Candidatus Azobacteroides sp.]|nr:ribosome assembly cofactor RimP [Candidatus Azobacteroides sp.]